MGNEEKVRLIRAKGVAESYKGTRAAQAPPPIIPTTPAPTTPFHRVSCRGGRGWEGRWGRLRRPRPFPHMAPALVALACLLLLSSCTFGSNTPTAPTITRSPTATEQPGPGNNLPSPTAESTQALLQTEQLLLTTPHPLRDLYSLAQRLKLHAATPIPHVGRTTPLNETLGQEDSFWINNSDTRAYSRIHAKLVYITPHVYIYVEDGQQPNLQALQASANLFENKTYPTDRSTYGSQWTPGIDANVHLTILNAIGLGNGVGGYFSSEDEYPTSINPYSNEREMFYVNFDGEVPGTSQYNSTLAHEFQHMIHWYQHPVDLSWTNEGMSMLAQHINGLSAGGVDLAFMQTPDTQLNDWASNINLDIAHYGAGYLFMDYFAEHYGGYGVLKELLRDPASPPVNFDNVLAKHGYADRFIDVLNKWYLANFVQDPTIDQGQYGYPSIQIAGLMPQHSITNYPTSEADTVHQYAAEYYNIEPQGHRGTLSITLQGAPTVRIIGNDPLGSNYEWWSNRYDNMNSTLTRSFDLTSLKGRRATLQFSTWYALEQDYDYVFVEASTDGVNWTTLKGNYTTTTNPNGANWGNGYTGTSGSGGTGAGGSNPSWIQDHIDLTPYAGKKVQIRFEQVTDDAVNLQGFALDSISIPELHFSDTVTSDNGWVSNGFIRSNNILPEHFTVQALIYSGTTFTVQSMAVDLASGQSTLKIPNFGKQTTRVVLVVSAYAPETTLLAHYQFSANLT
jgi:immune inhibitor A